MWGCECEVGGLIFVCSVLEMGHSSKKKRRGGGGKKNKGRTPLKDYSLSGEESELLSEEITAL